MTGCLIEWFDSVTTRGWHEPVKDGPEKIVSLALIAHEDENCVVIATSVGTTGHYADQMAIPRAAIKRMQRFEVVT